MRDTWRWSAVLIATVSALYPPGSLVAQDLRFGLKTGLTRADLLEIPSEEWHPRTSLAGGAVVSTRVNRWLGIRSELLLTPKYVFKSRIVDGPDGPVEVRFDRSPVSIEIPVLAHLTLPGGPSLLPGLLLGVAASYEVSCTETSFSRRLVDGLKISENENECDRRLTAPESPEISAVLGMLTELPLGGVTVGLEARYTRGLYDLGDSRYVAERNFPEHRTAALSVLAQVMFD